MSVTRVYGNYSDYALRRLVKNGSVSEQIDALCEASGNGNRRLMRALCKSDISPHVLDGLPGRRPLIIASQCQHSGSRMPLMDCLVIAGANIDIHDKHNKSLLQHAMSDYPDNPDYDRIMGLIRLGANANTIDEDKQSVFHFMLHKKFSHANIRMLIDKGAEVCARDNGGRTPLHIALQTSDAEIVKLLIKKGADFCAKDNDGSTPLHDVSRTGKEESVKLLIDIGADVCAMDNAGRTPLHEAMQSLSVGIVRILIDNGAQVCAKDNFGRTPLHETPTFSFPLSGGKRAEGCTKFMQVLIANHLIEKGADIYAKDNAGRTPLHEAITSGSGNLALHLMSKGADICTKDNAGRTPLHEATTSGSGDFAKHLIDKGADIRAKDNEGRTILHVAMQSMNEDIIRLLIDKGAQVCAKDNSGMTPLHDAVLSEKKGSFKLYGRTTIPRAAMSTKEVIVNILISNGANVCAKDNDGRTPLHEAIKHGDDDIVKHLIDKGADVHVKDKAGLTPLHEAVVHTNGNILNLLRDNGADVHVKDNDGRTPLHKAAERKNIYLVRYLIANGAGVCVKDNEGRTPLHEAAQFNNSSAIELLIEKCGRLCVKDYVNAKDLYGLAPLHEAAKHGTRAMIVCLIKHGSDIYSRDCNGKTAMDYAANKVKDSEKDVYGQLNLDILWPFMEQRGFPADLMTDYIYHIGKDGWVMKFYLYDHDFTAILHRLVQFGCGIGRQCSLNRFVSMLFKKCKLPVLLYLMSTGLFPTFIAFIWEIRFVERCSEGKLCMDDCVIKMLTLQSLKCLCRDKVRQTLYRASNGSEIVSIIGDMSVVPAAMKSFLCLEGLDSMLSKSAADAYDDTYNYYDRRYNSEDSDDDSLNGDNNYDYWSDSSDY